MNSSYLGVSQHLLFTVILICVAFVGAVPAQTNASQSRERAVILTAADKDERAVNSLKASDLQLFEHDLLQIITGLELRKDQPLSVLIMMDTSMSQERTLEAEKAATTTFISSAIKQNSDRIGIATFAGFLKLQQGLTNEVSSLRSAIARAEIVIPPGYAGGGIVVGPLPPTTKAEQMASSTGIWDTVIEGANVLPVQSGVDSRRAIILLTDGVDTISENKLSVAIEKLNAKGIAVYAIGFGDVKTFGLEKGPLRRLAERTGGRALFPKHAADLTQTFEEIQDELRNYYVIRYESNVLGATARKLRIQTKNPVLKDVKLSYQQTVIASVP